MVIGARPTYLQSHAWLAGVYRRNNRPAEGLHTEVSATFCGVRD
jgi:hypothetical protein